MSKKQFFNLLYWVLIAGMGLYFAYMKGWIFANFESVTPQQAYTMIQTDKTIPILDVRTPEEYNQEHIEGSTLIPVQSLNDNLTALKSLKTRKILVYCHSGNRSAAASRILSDNGFTPINIKGGIAQWKADGLTLAH